ncbi:MAG: hypothetical protein ACPGVU_01650 [Limisphaerales bacterium]
MSSSSITGFLFGWIWLISGVGLLSGADAGEAIPTPPVIKSPVDLQAWLPGTRWKQVDANWRFVFEEEIVRRPRSKNKMPWKVTQMDAVEVTASKGKRLHTYRFHESHRWFTNDHKGQVFQLEKQKDELATQAPDGGPTNDVTEPFPVDLAVSPSATKEAAPAGILDSKTVVATPLSLPLKIAGGVLALPLAGGLLALVAGLIGGSPNSGPNSLRSDEAPTGIALEDHSDNTGRLIGGTLLYAAGFAGLAAMLLNRPHSYMENMAYPFLVLLLILGLNLMFLRFHLILTRNPKGLTKWWGVLSVPCEVRAIRGDQLQRIEVTRESHGSGSNSENRRPSYSYPVRLKHKLGTADLDRCSDFETARQRGERIAQFMGLDLHASADGRSKSRKSGTPDQSLRDQVQAGTQKIEVPPRPGDSEIQRNLDGNDVVFELPPAAGQPREKIYVSAQALRVEHGDETFAVTSDQIASLDVKETHRTFEMLKEETGVDGVSNSIVGNFAMEFADKQYAKQRLQAGKNAALAVFGEGGDHEFGYRLTPEDAHWLRANLCQILTS